MTSAMCSYITGTTRPDSPQRVHFVAHFKHGKGTRALTILVDAAKIAAIAEAMKHTDTVGHAVWHAENPDRPMPCSSCKG